MNPWLLYTEHLRLPTYFTCLMVGFTLAIGVLQREARRSGVPARVVLDGAIWALAGALIGSRLLDALVVAPAWYREDLWRLFSPQGGLVFYGGALGGVLAVSSYARRRSLDPWAMLDIFTVATPFGLVFGRIGCLGGGCCYGRRADWPLGVEVPWAVRYYPQGQLPDALTAVPLHPAPLYAVALALCLFVGLSWLRGRQRFAGQILLAFLVFYGLGRSGLEVMRADVTRGVYFGLVTTSQIIGGTTALLAGALWWYKGRHAPDPVLRR